MAIEYSVICLEPHFVIKNESSHEQNIELTSVYIYKQRIRLNKEWTQSRSLDSGEETELETWDSYFGPEKYILSFLFIIDGKNYAGWASTEGNFGIDIIEYELGYVNTQESFSPLLSSKLEPGTIEEGGRENIAFYTVTITDEGVVFVLDKQIDGLYPSC